MTAKTSGAASDLIATTQTFTDGSNVFDDTTLGATRAGADIDEDDWGFDTFKEIHNPFETFPGFKRPKVNVRYSESEHKLRSKVDKKGEYIFFIDIFAEEDSNAVQEGLTLAGDSVNRVIRQIIYILDSPKYKNLRLDYQDSQGNLVKFIEKLSVSNVKKVFTSDLPKENVAIAQLTYTVEMIENLFDLDGASLTLINALLEEPTL